MFLAIRLLLSSCDIKQLKISIEYPIIVQPDQEADGFVVSYPTLKGFGSQGETEEEVLSHIKDAIKTSLKSVEDPKR
ncbi:type II toxin-antitoxin system HicB family antitoxin [Candidatus Nitrospira salsa]